MRTITIALAALSLAAAPASAANWGTGTFTGRAKSSLGTDRPHTGVTLVAKSSRVRIKSLKLSFHCSNQDGLPERLPVRVSSKFVRVKPGAAGGGAMIDLEPRVRHGGKTYRVDGDVFLGLRTTTITGTADAYLMDARGSAVCEDAATFTAHRR
jgi:hypothetical protein